MLVFVFSAIVIIIPHKSFQEVKQKEEEDSCGNPKEAFSLPRVTSLNIEYGCPAHSEEEINRLKKLSSMFPEWENCLIEKNFTENENARKLCQTEVKPLFFLAKGINKNTLTCGGKKNRYVYNFGYLYCKNTDDQPNPDQENQTKPTEKDPRNYSLENVQHIPIYSICYDILENKTIWTRHQIRTPALFSSPEFQEEHYCDTEISTEGYFFGSKHFLKIQQKYHLEKKKNPSVEIKMLPQPLVPADHFFKRFWKKATNHFINIAPLWSNLKLLMTTIDAAIKLVAIKAKIGRFGTGEDLLIYTRTKPYFPRIQKLKNIFKTVYFEPNIWYKFVYSAARKSGVMIHIRNTPGNPAKLKKTQISCDFEAWAKQLNIQDKGNKDEGGITLPGLNYAYCTKPTAKYVKQIFHIDVIVQGFLDLDGEMQDIH